MCNKSFMIGFLSLVYPVFNNCYRQRRLYIDSLKSEHCLTCNNIVFYSYASGNNLGSIHFVWMMYPLEKLAERNQECLRPSLPLYHTRAMRKEFYSKVSLFKGMMLTGEL